MTQRYFLDQDNDSHWYIVPVAGYSAWHAWLQLNGDDPASWIAPEFAIPVGGSPTLVEFENPTIDGKEVGAVK